MPDNFGLINPDQGGDGTMISLDAIMKLQDYVIECLEPLPWQKPPGQE